MTCTGKLNWVWIRPHLGRPLAGSLEAEKKMDYCIFGGFLPGVEAEVTAGNRG